VTGPLGPLRRFFLRCNSSFSSMPSSGSDSASFCALSLPLRVRFRWGCLSINFSSARSADDSSVSARLARRACSTVSCRYCATPERPEISAVPGVEGGGGKIGVVRLSAGVTACMIRSASSGSISAAIGVCAAGNTGFSIGGSAS
jgi:hypothetical protein